MLVLSLRTNTHLLNQNSEVLMSQQADTVAIGSSVSVRGHEYGDAVHVANLTVTDGVSAANFTHEGLLGETSDTHQSVTGARGNDQETVVHRDIVVVQTLNRAADSSIGQSASSAGVSGSAVSTRESTSVVSSAVTAVNTTAQTNQIGINLTSKSVASVISVELTQRSQSLSLNDVLDQTRVLVVLVDVHNDFALGSGDQSNLSLSRLNRSVTTGRRRNVNRITFLAFEVHLLDEVGSNEVLLVAGDNFVTPNFRNKGIRGSGSNVSGS